MPLSATAPVSDGTFNGNGSFLPEISGIYITKECLENSDTAPLLYSPVNHCVFVNDTWIPLEDYQKSQTTNNKNQVSDA